jgi:hypothetical protein
MKYNQIPPDLFKTIQTGAGFICKNFNVFTGEATGYLGATTGGLTISITPNTKDYGEDIDNVKKNTFQLKRIDDYEAKMSGTFVSASKATHKSLLGSVTETTETPPSGTTGAAYNSVTRLSPNVNYDDSDFETLWWVGDYTDDNNSTDGKYLAVRMDNCINTSGFSLKTTDKEKGQFSFEYLAHYSLVSDNIPFAIFMVENNDGE